MTRATAAAIGTGLLLLCATGCSGASSSAPRAGLVHAAPSAAELLNRASDDAVGKQFMQSTTTLRQSGKVETLRQTDLEDGGRQLVRFGAIRAEIRVIGSRAFITGNGEGMVKYFGFPKRLRSELANRWIAFTPSDAGYKTVVAGVGIRADFNALRPAEPLILTTSTLAGRGVDEITGSVPRSDHPPSGATESIYLSKGPNPLPIRMVALAPNGMTETTTISRWGSAATIAVPTEYTPVTQIAGL